MPARIIGEASFEGSPTEDEPIVVPTPHIPSDNDVVISGISCRLPESDNMAEFREHLVNGEDMVTEDNRRWEPGLSLKNYSHSATKNVISYTFMMYCNFVLL